MAARSSSAAFESTVRNMSREWRGAPVPAQRRPPTSTTLVQSNQLDGSGQRQVEWTTYIQELENVWHTARTHLEAEENTLQQKAAYCPAIAVPFAKLQVPALLLSIATQVIEDARARAQNDFGGSSNEYGNEAYDPSRWSTSPFVCAPMLPDTPVLVALLEQGMGLLGEMQLLINDLYFRYEARNGSVTGAAQAFLQRERGLMKRFANALLEQANGAPSTAVSSRPLAETRLEQFIQAPMNELTKASPDLTRPLNDFRLRVAAFQQSMQEMLPRSSGCTDLDNAIWRTALQTRLPSPGTVVLVSIMQGALEICAEELGHAEPTAKTISALYALNWDEIQL